MSNWELIDENRDLGIRKYLASDPNDPEGCLVRHEFSRNVTNKILDENKREENHFSSGRMGDMALAARIPIEVMYEWKTKFGVDAWRYASDPDVQKRVNKLLNSSDYRYLKCRNIIL